MLDILIKIQLNELLLTLEQNDNKTKRLKKELEEFQKEYENLKTPTYLYSVHYSFMTSYVGSSVEFEQPMQIPFKSKIHVPDTTNFAARTLDDEKANDLMHEIFSHFALIKTPIKLIGVTLVGQI